MATTSELNRQIRELEDLLNSGASSITVDGITTNYASPEAIRTRIKELRAKISRKTRPTLSRCRMD